MENKLNLNHQKNPLQTQNERIRKNYNLFPIYDLSFILLYNLFYYYLFKSKNF